MTNVSQREPRKIQPRYSELLDACRDLVLHHSHSLLTDMFMGADDALLDSAEKAKTNAAQSRYFEAMREVRHKRVPVEHAFRKEILKGFELFAQGQPIYAAIKTQAKDAEKLSLVGKADVEESVSIQNIVSKANNNFFHTLYELRQRLAVVNAGRKVDSTNMPSSPSHLCKAFQTASQAFEVDTEVKLIIFSLFDRFVMDKAAVIYDQFNKRLLDAEILPNIGTVIRKELESKHAGEEGSTQPPPKLEQPHPQLPESGDRWLKDVDEHAGKELYQSLFQLLAHRRENPPVSQLSNNIVPAGADSWKPIDRTGLASVINALQPANSVSYSLPDAGAYPNNVQLLLDHEVLESIRETLVKEREALFSSIEESEQSVDTIDADTIELVGMLFEFMLNYESLPNAAKALISHLHTPFLMVAVLDKEFLIRSSHPARQLLNMLVDAGCRWVNEASLDTGIFSNMQEVVERVLDEFKDDLNLFDVLLQSFAATVEEFKTKTRVIETRTREAAKGRDKLQVAKNQAKEEMEAKLRARNLPDEVEHFLLKPWTDRLTFILLRNSDGKESEEWKNAVKIADALIWAVGPKNSEYDRNRLKKVLPKLRKSVEKGLSALGGYSHIHAEVLFDTIDEKRVHTKRRVSRVQPTTDNAEDKQTPTATVTDTSPAFPASATPKLKRKVELTAEEEAMADKLRQVEFGTWFELNADSPERRQRAKLSWYSPLTANFMFVDNSGVQCAVRSIEDLAKEMLNSNSKILKFYRIPFVDRALTAIRKILDRSTEQPA